MSGIMAAMGDGSAETAGPPRTPSEPARSDLASPTPRSFFERTVVGWDIAFWAMLVLALGVALVDDLRTADRWLAIILASGLGVSYATFGRSALRSRAPIPRHVYRIVLVIAIGGLVALTPAASLVLYIAFPQVWVFSERIRGGLAYSTLLVATFATGQLIKGGFASEVLEENLPWWAISLAVSFVFGTWVSKVIDESHSRAVLIARLERTQAELAQANHAAGVVAERERVSREIHDTLAQGFTAIVALSAAAQADVTSHDTDGAGQRLRAIEDIARENLAEARALVGAYAPVGLDGSSLTDALHRLAARFESETGVRVTVSIMTADGDEQQLPAAYQVVLLRIAQEALSNVRKHAGARNARIALATDRAGAASIEVLDDGAGFTPGPTATRGFGLTGMRDRVEATGGHLEIDSAPGTGTLVRARLPAVSAA